MASGYQPDFHGAAPAPDRDTPNPRHASQPDPLAFGMLSKFGEGQAVLTESIKHLKEAIDKQGAKIDKIDDLRVDVGKLSRDIEHLQKDLGDATTKLDKVRVWIFAAAGVLAVAAAFGPPIVTRFLLTPPSAPAATSGQAQPQQGKSTRQNSN